MSNVWFTQVDNILTDIEDCLWFKKNSECVKFSVRDYLISMDSVLISVKFAYKKVYHEE